MGFFDIFKGKKVPERIEEKASRTAILQTESGTAHWFDKNYDTYARETYLKNIISFKCMDLIAKSIASISWNLYTKDAEGKRVAIEKHPLNSVLKRANPEESFSFLMMKMTLYYLIAGDAFMERVSPTSGPNKGIPKELYALRPDKIKIELNPTTGLISQYVYDSKIIYPVDPVTMNADLLHVKSFNPIDDFWGSAITDSAAREIDSANEATEWQKKMFENEGRPGMTILVKGMLTDSQFDRLEKQLKDKYSGAQNAGKNLILEGETGIDAKPYNWSPKELDFLESNRELARRICLAYGVPPLLLGLPGDNTYANYKEARLSFWEDTIIFYLDFFRDEMNKWFFPDVNSKLFLDYDLEQVPAMTVKRDLLWERAEKASFLTINEKREMVGMPAIDGGDVLLVPMGMSPLDSIEDDSSAEETVQETDDQEEQDDEEAIKKLIEKGFSREEAEEMIGVKSIPDIQ